MVQTVPLIVQSKKFWRVGFIPGCVQLGACDIGRASLFDGRTVYCTCGRNLSMEEIIRIEKCCLFEYIDTGEVWDHKSKGMRRNHEIILPNDLIKKLPLIRN